MKHTEIFDALRGHLIVSCQALADEPLHSSYIMSRMAFAAFEGGARGIRSNSVEDIKAIEETVDLPVIGLVREIENAIGTEVRSYQLTIHYICPECREKQAEL